MAVKRSVLLGLLLVLFTVSAWTEAAVVRRVSEDDNEEDEEEQSVTEQPQEVRNNLVLSDQTQERLRSRLRSRRTTEPCTLQSCMWPKAADGNVYVPYVIADLHFTSQQLKIIRKAIDSFSFCSCVRFIPRSGQKDFLHIQSLDGCYSYVGRQGDGQTLSLNREGCVYYGTVQHELLHALGFSHEHCRADRDRYIQVLLRNVMEGEDYNFRKRDTLNQRTPYDYGSVMHYGRLAFSRDNRHPTMVAVPDHSATFGTARKMSGRDVERINLLYCTD